MRLAGLSSIANDYDLLICDLWGVVHDGLTPYPGAINALTRFRAAGGCVVFLSNAPRPEDAIARHLARLGVVEEARDAIVSSGDLTRLYLTSEAAGKKILHLGPERDLTIFEGLDAELSGPDEADLIVCSGFADDQVQTPEDYREVLQAVGARGLRMICANPDRQVMRGKQIIPCAGAMADVYEGQGGTVVWLGKPYTPAYERSRTVAADVLNRMVAPDRTLCIGDGLLTDVPGANAQDLPVLVITGGLHAAEFSEGDREPDGADVMRLLQARGLSARAHAPRLVW